MKTKINIGILFLILFTVMCAATQKASAQGPSVSFQVFYDELSPYGTWIYNSDYGYVWLPDVAPGFAPYSTNGYWLFTDEGWTWVSDYSWGWAPFHYGRWFTDDNYGPMWVPDYEWGPGWVTWRRSSDYYGWAPISPGISINIAYGNGYNEHNNRYTFVRGRDFGRRDINQYYVNRSNNVTIINNTIVINNTRVDRTRNVTYNTGPDRSDVERRGGRKITPFTVKEGSQSGHNVGKNEFQTYRPQVQRENSNGPKPTPSRVADLKDVKTSSQRKADYPAQKANQPNKQQQQNRQPQKQQQPAQQQQNRQPQKQQQPAQQQQNRQQQKQQQPAQQQQNRQQQKQQQPAQQQQNRQQQKQQQPAQQQQNRQQQKQQQPAQQQQNRQQQKQQQPAQQQQNRQQQKQQQPAQQQQTRQPQKQQQPAQQQQTRQHQKQQQPEKQQKPRGDKRNN